MKRLTRRDLLKAGIAATATSGATIDTYATEQAKVAGRTPPPPAREKLLLDFGWRFHLGHAGDPAKDFDTSAGRRGAFGKSGQFFGQLSRANYDDSQWRAVDLPHDWAVELDFENHPGLVAHGAKPLGRSYPATSIGWYRRVFDVPKEDSGRRISIEFDGVFRDCTVALNGHYLGRNLSGYAPFRFDASDFLNYGEKNVLVVRVDATEFEGWFYEGAGIYRHVWLVKTSPVHVAHWGTFVTSEVRAEAATLTIATEVENDSDQEKSCRIASKIVNPAGKTIAVATSLPAAISPWTRREFKQQVLVTKPALWSLEDPNLYRLATTVESGANRTDDYETTFGIRTIRSDPDKGFFLNGKPVKVLGTCNHQDHAGVGAALPDRLQSYRLEKLKEMGCNAYRASHNPPTPELLDVCDRLGVLVMDETRMMSASREGLSQLERMVRRDRNHPSVIWWSLGNEEPEQGTERGARIGITMKRLVRRLDPTRPVAMAMDNGWGKGMSGVVDVQGFNYRNARIDDFHKLFPKHPCIGSEVASTVATRGIYANDEEKGYLSAYDLNAPRWGNTAEDWWTFYAVRPFLAGGFIWTGFDYRGEPTPYSWPCINSHFGILDTCGFPKDGFYYYQAWWTAKPVLHLFPHWNWPGREGQEIDVWVHTNLDSVELFLNGASLGAKQVERNSHLAWKATYTQGLLHAVGYRNGKQVMVAKRQTTGPAAKIELRPDRARISADGEDVSVVEVRVLDSEGQVVPVAANEISFRVSGSGRIIGVGNGDPSSHEPDKAEKRRAFNGLCMAIVQASKHGGEIRLEATSPSLSSAAAVIECAAATPRPAV